MIAIATGPRFSLGPVVITANALGKLPSEDVRAALRRHGQGDWGNLARSRPGTKQASARIWRPAFFRLHHPKRDQVLRHHRVRPQRNNYSSAGGLLT